MFMYVCRLAVPSLCFTGIQCASLSPITNGDVSHPEPVFVRDVAAYSCDTGYNITDGSQTRTCTQRASTGYWDGSQPRCACERLTSF